MQIGGGTFRPRGFTPFGQLQRPETTRPEGPGRETLRIQLKRVDDEIGDLRAALTSIRARGRSRRAPSALGTVRGLDLVVPATRAILSSREEVNTEATQLSSRTPQWAGAGGRDVGVSGIYSGAADDTLTFTVAHVNGRQIDVTNGAGDLVGSYTLDPSSTASVVDLPDGLSVAFGVGTKLAQGDSFTLDVFASQDGAIDPDDPFDGVGASSPRFAEGTTITGGSFSVNGVSISVAANDSLNDVLARITSQVVGVTATYDAASERVLIQSDETGSDQSVEITDDTSGLIAALKLDGLGRATGQDGRSADQPLSQSAGFEGVTAGTITVNGVDIALDPSTQSLNDVLALINDVDGVSARTDILGRVLLTGTAGETLTLTDGGTGLADALGLRQGVHHGRKEDKQTISDFAARRIANELLELRSALDALVDNEGLVGLVADMRTDVGVAVETALRDSEGLEDLASLTRLDNFDNDRVASKSRTSAVVRTSYSDLRALFLDTASNDQNGLLGRLDQIVRDGLGQVDRVDVRV